MKGLLRLAIVCAIGYGLYTYFINREVEGPGPDHGESDTTARCIDRLDDAIDALGSAVREFGAPPVDVEAWEDRFGDLQQSIDFAAGGCQCAEDACKKGLEAAQQLDDLVAEMNGGIVGGTGPPTNAVTRMNRIIRVYEDAKALAR